MNLNTVFRDCCNVARLPLPPHELINWNQDSTTSSFLETFDLMESDLPEQSLGAAEIPLTRRSSCRKAQVEDSDVSSIDDQDELVPRPVRKKRPNRRYTECSSDDEYCLRALKRSIPKYKEVESSSESESDFTQPARDTVLKPTGLPIGVVRGCPKCSDCQVVLARWRPEEGCQPSVAEAPVFYPTEEEFKDTLEYIAKIRPAAEPFGICRVVPPPGWKPPCPLREDIANPKKFPTRVQEIHKLQVRQPVKKFSQARQRVGGRRGRGGFRGRMGRPCRRTSILSTTRGSIKSLQPDESFGFEPGSYFSLGMFEKYAQLFKEQYFRKAAVANELQGSPDTNGPASRTDLSVDDIEAEYWRIVERPTEQLEVLYGADVETGSFGSGFPKAKVGDTFTDPNCYEKSGWNLNNIARLPGSMLAFEEGDISGVLVPWLYVGMCFSSFCWHVEDHHFYSLNYLHWGAPKVWYGVPGHAANDMEVFMKKHLPGLFDEQPDLLHKLVTQLSPSILKEEGLPVYRLLQQAGEFVITFPRAYHSGFNCGFNCAEAVNLAPVDWLPHGQGAVELYREQRRKTSVSHDKLLLAASRAAAKDLLQSQRVDSSKQSHVQVDQQEVQEGCKRSRTYGNDQEVACAKQVLCRQGGVLVNALKARVTLECTRQATLIGEVQMRKMDHCYDATDERECAECHYDLYLSAVGCACCPERYVCLAHAPLLCVCQWGRKFVMYRYDLAQLELLVAALEEQPGALCDWFDHEQRSVSASSVSTLSPFSHAGHQGPGSMTILGPCETNSTEFQFVKSGFIEQEVVTNLPSQKELLSSKCSLGGSNSLSHQWCGGIYSQPTTPVQHNSWAYVNKIVPVQPLPSPAASGLDEKARNISGLQGRAQLGMFAESKRLQNGFVKSESCVLETTVLKTSQEVIVLSDDEDGTQCVVVSSIAKSLEESCVGLHALSSTIHSVDGIRCNAVLKKSTSVGDARVDSVEKQDLAPDILYGALPGELHTAGCGVPLPGLNMPSGTSTQLPSIHSPLSKASAHRPAMEGCSIVSSPSPRLRSIGSLKQQARAMSTQHLGNGSRVMKSRADHVQRLQSGQEVSGAELRGHEFPVDTLPSTFMETGNMQSCTPTRIDHASEPQVAQVLGNKVWCKVELLNVGSLIQREGWHNKHSIFPAGFRSRTSFCNVLDVLQTCNYVSEVVECGQAGPRFKVSAEGNNSAAFVDDSIDVCWQTLQEKINEEIIRRRGIGDANLPPLRLPQSLHGLDMFGFTSATIVQAVEALDPHHQCCEYWSAKLGNAWMAGHDPSACTPECLSSTSKEARVLRPKRIGANVEGPSRPTTPIAETLSRHVSGECATKRNVDLYGVLKGFFQKGKSDELWALHQVFSCDWQSKEWRDGFQALTDVLVSRHPSLSTSR